MRALVRAFKKFPPIRQLAQQLATTAPSKAWSQQINAVFVWVQTSIKYVSDITDVETLQTPSQTLSVGSGDCDDVCTLLAALLEAVGFHTRFMAVAFTPGEFEHVFVQVQLPDRSRWYSLDATEAEPMGWQPPDFIDWMVRDN